MPWRALMRLAELYRDEESPNFRRGDTAAEYFESVQEDVEYFLSRGQLARAQETVEETLSDLEYATDDEFLDPNDPEVTAALEALEAFTIILDLSEMEGDDGWGEAPTNTAEAGAPGPRSFPEAVEGWDLDALREHITFAPGWLDGGNGQDTTLAWMWAQKGFDGLPRKADDFEWASRSGELEVEGRRAPLPVSSTYYRGFTGSLERVEEYARQFREGEPPYAGLGFSGNGTYASLSAHVAADFGPRLQIELALAPDARGITRDALKRLQTRLEGRLEMEARSNPEDSDKNETLQAIVMDLGRLATFLGYDFIDNTASPLREIVILNRTKVLVPETWEGGDS
jgi:hypothetical protein